MDFDAADFLAGLFRSARQFCPADLSADRRDTYEERAAIMEYHGGLSRDRAEAEALAETVELMKAGKSA